MSFTFPSARHVVRGAANTGCDRTQVCSLILHARAERLDDLQNAISALSGVEVHGRDPAGKFIVTVEAENDHDLVQVMGALGELPGVLSCALIYQHAESAAVS